MLAEIGSSILKQSAFKLKLTQTLKQIDCNIRDIFWPIAIHCPYDDNEVLKTAQYRPNEQMFALCKHLIIFQT